MTASDGSLQGEHASDRLVANKERVLATWEERLREQVPAARAERQPVLVDTLPAVLDHLAEALSPLHPRSSATAGNTIAEEHGGERVRLTQFRLEDVVTEYRILREVLVDVLEDGRHVLTDDERRVVHGSIDGAIQRACTAFVLVQEGLKEEIFALLAHDLRGPLSAARAGLGLIMQRPASEHVPRWAARADANIDRVDRMVRDLLDAMHAQAGGRLKLDLEECDLVEIARESIESLQTEHGERFSLVASEPVRGWFAREHMRRAVDNLAANAVKYGAASRVVTVEVRPSHGRAILTVHNHGSYIPPEQRDTLFRAFHRLRGAGEDQKHGWGLGLAQVRAVAEAHGGSIAIDSSPDEGTTFILDVPADARPFQEAPTTP